MTQYQPIVDGLSLHDLLVQLVREREEHLLVETEDYGYGGERHVYKELDADAVAHLIEEVLGLAGH